MSQIHGLYISSDKVCKVVPFSGRGYRLIDGKEIIGQPTTTIDTLQVQRRRRRIALECELGQLYSRIPVLHQRLRILLRQRDNLNKSDKCGNRV